MALDGRLCRYQLWLWHFNSDTVMRQLRGGSTTILLREYNELRGESTTNYADKRIYNELRGESTTNYAERVQRITRINEFTTNYAERVQRITRINELYELREESTTNYADKRINTLVIGVFLRLN